MEAMIRSAVVWVCGSASKVILLVRRGVLGACGKVMGL